MTAKSCEQALWRVLEETLGENFAADRELHKSVLKLSRHFTEDRASLAPDYLDDPNLGAAYLAYFVPLNFEKVRTLLGAHKKDVWKSIPSEPQYWIDFGSGPGTAVLAALTSLREIFPAPVPLPTIQVDLVDLQASALTLAKELIESLAEQLELDVECKTHETLDSALSSHGENHEENSTAIYDLALAANVLNEMPAEQSAKEREPLLRLWEAVRGVMLVLEPGHRVSSQRLVRFRERLLKDQPKNSRIVGPCAHHERCPVYRTRDWCHFSEPLQSKRLIDLNLRIFKNPRGWLKFSYFMVRREAPAAWSGREYRAIGDLHVNKGRQAIDLCQPKEKLLFFVPPKMPPGLRASLVRGALVRIDKDKKISAKPMTPRRPRTTRNAPASGKPSPHRKRR